MLVRPPSIEQVLELGERFRLHLDEEEAAAYRRLIAGVLPSYDRLDQLVEPAPPVRYPRPTGYRPGPEENPLNAWAWKAEIRGATGGPLAEKRIAVKDNTCVAGLPMRNGSKALEGYVPDVDATVVTRILDAGGTILGKSVCEDLCFSGGSHTSKPLPVLNPHRPTHSAGGSSSGSAALVASGEVDMALGGDQGGSIRMPASWSGVYGLKPTHGLVPYTGIFPIELTIDHTGPMAGSMSDLALLLSVVAGPDPLDPRSVAAPSSDYLRALEGDGAGVHVGILREGFGRPESEAAVDEAVREAISRLEDAGARVEEVSIPMHLEGFHIWTGVIIEGSTQQMIKGNGFGANWKGYYATSLIDAYGRGWRSTPDQLSETVKLVLLLGEYLNEAYGGRYYAKAQNLRRTLTTAYDDALSRFDVLALPTTPMKAQPLPPPDCGIEEYVARALEMVTNTCPFDVSGHPALSVPCGLVDGLPVGLMLVGRTLDEETVLRVAAAFERTGAWEAARGAVAAPSGPG